MRRSRAVGLTPAAMEVTVGVRGEEGGAYGAQQLRNAASQSGLRGFRQLAVEALGEALHTGLLVLHLEETTLDEDLQQTSMLL